MFIESSAHAEIIQRIEAAGLRSSAYRTARRLVDMAGDNGHVTLTKAQVMAICEVSAWDSARKHLALLSKRGVLHYSTNEQVYVNIYGAPDQYSQQTLIPTARAGSQTARVSTPAAPTGSQTAPTGTQTARVSTPAAPTGSQTAPTGTQTARVSTPAAPTGSQTAPTGTQTARVSTPAAPTGSQTARVGSQTAPTGSQTARMVPAARVGSQTAPTGSQTARMGTNDPTVCLFVVNTPTHPGENEQTNKQTTVRILTDDAVGLAPATAERFRNDDPQWVMGHVFAWLHDLEAGRVRGHGALIHRLEKGWDSPPPSEADRATPLYRRHFGDDIERRREYLPDEYAGIIRG